MKRILVIQKGNVTQVTDKDGNLFEIESADGEFMVSHSRTVLGKPWINPPVYFRDEEMAQQYVSTMIQH